LANFSQFASFHMHLGGLSLCVHYDLYASMPWAKNVTWNGLRKTQ